MSLLLLLATVRIVQDLLHRNSLLLMHHCQASLKYVFGLLGWSSWANIDDTSFYLWSSLVSRVAVAIEVGALISRSELLSHDQAQLLRPESSRRYTRKRLSRARKSRKLQRRGGTTRIIPWWWSRSSRRTWPTKLWSVDHPCTSSPLACFSCLPF